jgi:hypothetical protein
MPYIEKQYIEDVDDRIYRWTDLLETVNATAWAWVFPACTRRLRASGNDYCPGTAVLIREI